MKKRGEERQDNRDGWFRGCLGQRQRGRQPRRRSNHSSQGDGGLNAREGGQLQFGVWTTTFILGLGSLHCTKGGNTGTHGYWRNEARHGVLVTRSTPCGSMGYVMGTFDAIAFSLIIPLQKWIRHSLVGSLEASRELSTHISPSHGMPCH